MFRTLRIVSVLIVTSLAIFGYQIDLTSINSLSHQQTILMVLVIILGVSNILVEIFDHHHQKKEEIKRAKEFENLRFQLSRPILPISVYSILCYPTKEESIQYVFSEKLRKRKSTDSEINGNLYTIDKEKLKEWTKWEYDHIGHLIKHPIGAELSFYKKKNNHYSDTPDLELGYGVLFGNLPKNPFPQELQKGLSIINLELHSGELYLDSIMYDWIIQQNSNQLLSIYDLRGAKAKFTFNIVTRDDIDFQTPPYFTKIDLKCGERPYNVIRLNMDLLGKVRVNSKDSCQYSGDNPNRPDSHLTIFYETILPEQNFESFLEQFN